MNPRVKLLTWTPDPMEVVYILWEASKVDGPIPESVEEVKATVPREKLEQLFWDVIRQRIPVSENIHFTFILDGVSVSLREQMVRHRIGVHVGDRLGVDIIPDIGDSSWWSQSMRIQDMGTFADREMYRVPDSLGDSDGPGTARELFHDTMKQIQESYKTLTMLGVPMEDARELIPLGAQHRISWDLNLAALLHIVGKRGCWILQLGIWGPIIHGMINELATKVHPMFARIVSPPCIDANDQFASCQYRLENARRMTQEDQHPPCPLWLCRDKGDGASALLSALRSDHVDGCESVASVAHCGCHSQRPIPLTVSARAETLIEADNLVPRHREMKERAEQYRTLWRHNPYTWEPE